VSVQDRCIVCAKHTIGSENHLGRTRWYILGDEAQVDARFIPFGHSIVLILTEDRGHGLCQMYHRLRNHFGHTRWYS
jgi:hypothetical protein